MNENDTVLNGRYTLKERVVAMPSIEPAELWEATDSDGNTYRTELHLDGPAETVPFTSYYTSGRKPEAMAEAVNDWLTQPR